jgi:hypothetical protein
MNKVMNHSLIMVYSNQSRLAVMANPSSLSAFASLESEKSTSTEIGSIIAPLGEETGAWILGLVSGDADAATSAKGGTADRGLKVHEGSQNLTRLRHLHTFCVIAPFEFLDWRFEPR